MTNRFLTLLLVIMLVCGSLGVAALAETREEILSLEGEPETIQTTLFESSLGYKIWYDAQRFAVVDGKGEAPDQLLPADADAIQGVSLTVEHLSADQGILQVADAQEAAMKARYPNAERMEGALELLQGVAKGSLGLLISGYTDTNETDVYLADEGTGTWVLTVECPPEAQEGYGGRIRQMLKSFEPAHDAQ